MDQLLDIELPENQNQQMDLPGFAMFNEKDLDKSLELLEKEVEKLIPSDQELDLLRKFRNSDDENRKLILQLMS